MASKKCKTRSEFARKYDAAYRIAIQKNWIHLFRHMKPVNNWKTENIRSEAKKYKSRMDFKNNSRGAYSAALRLNILDAVCKHMVSKYDKWNLTRVREEAKKYSTPAEFLKKSPNAYKYAARNNLLQKICPHMIRRIKPEGYWTKKRVLREARKYRTRRQFKLASEVAYMKTLRFGWQKDVFKHMERVGNLYKRAIYIFEFEDKSVYVGITSDYSRRYNEHTKDLRSRHKTVRNKIKSGLKYKYYEQNKWLDKEKIPREEQSWINWYRKHGWKILNIAKAGGLGGGYLYWTKEMCLKDAQKHGTRTEWQLKGSKSAYNSAYKNGWLDEICRHMPSKKTVKRGTWTKAKCIELAKSCKNYADFRLNHRGAYQAVKINNWKTEIKKIFKQY